MTEGCLYGLFNTPQSGFSDSFLEGWRLMSCSKAFF